MKIAILGARGIPACYSGYDTLAEELALRLARSEDTSVIVYCRKSYYKVRPASYEGIHLAYIPVPRIKAVESLLHSLLSSLHVLTQRADVVYFLDPANAPFGALLRMLGKRVVIHTDGLGWKRRKWGPMARRYYKMVEWVCARTATALVTDNPVMQSYYEREYGAQSAYIPYGAESHYGLDDSVFKQFGVEPNRYLLVVARLEPENNTDLVIGEYTKSNLDLPLLIVGDSPYDSAFMARLTALADDRVIFAGRLSDQPKLNALYAGAYSYIHAHEVGGTNPSLLRAMHAGTAPVVMDVPFNTTVVGGTGPAFNKNPGNLSQLLEELASKPGEVKRAGVRAKARAQTHFNWDDVAREHAQLFGAVVTGERWRKLSVKFLSLRADARRPGGEPAVAAARISVDSPTSTGNSLPR